jgi:IS30 family transposase
LDGGRDGVTSEDAAETIGVSPAVGTRWFRHRGGMPLFMAKPVSGRYVSFAEREEIGRLRAQDVSVREIARRTGRSPSTVSRELTRNAATRGGQLEYRASVAQWKAEMVARRPKPAKLVIHQQLRHYVQDRLEGKIRDAAGREIAGPRPAPFKGRNTPHRGDRKWATGWSPEQIARRLQIDFPNDESMRISHEAIYQALYIQGRGALKRELVSCLRTGRALRVQRPRQPIRFSKEQPGECVRGDVKTVKAAGQKYVQYTALDDCTQYRVLRPYPRKYHGTSVDCLATVWQVLPFLNRRVPVDNGTECPLAFALAVQAAYATLPRGGLNRMERWHAVIASMRKTFRVARGSTALRRRPTRCVTGSIGTTTTAFPGLSGA